MGTGFTLVIPYDQLMLLVMGLFMFIGAMRGWYREFITSCGLIALTAILIKPELTSPIIDYLSKFIRLIIAFIQGRGSLDFDKWAARYRAIQLSFDGKNPYMLLIIVLVGFVFISYGSRGDTKGVSALSRILGGLLGLLNGFLAISLFKEYIVKYFQKSSAELQAAGPPPQVSVAVKGLPTGELLRGQGFQIMAALLAIMVVIVFISNVMGKPLGKK